MSSSEPLVILRYDTKNRHIFNVWEEHAELDPKQLLLSNASLLLHKPNIEEHSGTYTCIISGPQSRHVIQTDVNITASALSKCNRLQILQKFTTRDEIIGPIVAGEGELKARRSWWCTAASVGFFIFLIAVMLPRCVRPKSKLSNR